MGAVYEAEDTVLGRTVAVKTIEPAFGINSNAMAEFEQRFFTEAQVAAKLSHPGIVVCHDVGKDPESGKLFIVFEHLKGQTLAERLAAGHVPWRTALSITARVARAIHHAHEHGVIHRDLKPANIMLLGAGPDEYEIKIMDFGVAKLESNRVRLTATGQAFGSPLYMSPEQALGHWSDSRTDIFSLGSVLCTVLLGRPCFDAANIPKILARVVHDDPPIVSKVRRDVPEAVDRIVAHALAKRVEGRYQTAASLAEDLEDLLAGQMPRHTHGWIVAPTAMYDGDDALLAEMTAPPGTDFSAVRTGTVNVLASLVEEEPQPLVRERGGAGRWIAAAAAVMGAAALGGAFLVWSEAQSDLTQQEAAQPDSSLREAPQEQLATPFATPTLAPQSVSVAAIPATTAMTTEAPLGEVPSPVPEAQEPAATAAPTAAAAIPPEPATAAPTAEAAATRVRLTVLHPLENGRLIVWMDGVLVFETKLRAEVAKKIVAIKLREGHVEKMLDVAPGRHEVKVEMSWEDKRRVGTTLLEVGEGSTGLLEVRLARVTNDLDLKWNAPAATP
jgi:hypothetical protein